jgi:hypothetical protein
MKPAQNCFKKEGREGEDNINRLNLMKVYYMQL